MNKKKIAYGILAGIMAMYSLAACSSAKKYEWVNDCLSYSDVETADISEPVAAETISDKGREYLSDLRSQIDDVPEDEEEMYSIAYNEGVMYYPAGNGDYFMTAGYGWQGGVGVLWNEVYLISDVQSSVLYSGESEDYIVSAAAEGGTLYLLWQDGVLSSVDSKGKLTELCNMRKDLAENVSMGIDSTLSGEGSKLAATVEFYEFNEGGNRHRTDKVVYDISNNTVDIAEGVFA